MEETRQILELSDLGPGDHLCCIYGTEEEHRALITPFLLLGLQRGEKVLYIVDARTAEEILGYLRCEGADVDACLESGQLRVLSASDSYMREGEFDPDGMIRLLEQETRLALSQGYSALRVTGEMTWALRELPGSDRLMEYEAKLNRFFPGSACLAVCQYDRRRFSPEILLDVLNTHPIAVIGTEIYYNFYYISPGDYLGNRLPEAELERRISNLERHRRMEESLRENEEKYRSIVDSAQEGIWTVDERGVITFVNQRMADMLGFAVEEMNGVPFTDFMRADMRELAWDDLQKRREGISETFEFALRRRDGTELPVSMSTSPLTDDKGAFMGSLALISDIGMRKQAEQALAREVEVNQALAELSRMLLADETISDIAYEVLEIAKRLTDSPFGYAGYIDVDTGYMVTPTLTREIWEGCRVAGKDIVFKNFTGLWGWVLKNHQPLLTNAPGEDPRSSGTPPGHVPIERFISVPALMGETLVGQIALANASRDYDERDLALLQRLADIYAVAVLRMWAEGELERYREHLEDLVRERTLDLERANRQLREEIAERVRQERELVETARQLRALSARLQSVREEERLRIARDVHDNLGQVLTGLKIQLALLGKRIPPEAGLEKSLEDILGHIDEAIQSVRDICTELRPGILDDLGLAAALEWQLKQFEEMTGIRCSFFSSGDGELDREANIALFRITQEALTNIARHAEATAVEVRLVREGDELVLEVGDNGRGLRGEAGEAGSLGLLGMKERAHALGGAFFVASEAGGGTRLTVRVPLRGRGGRKGDGG